VDEHDKVDEMGISHKALRGLSQIAEELGDELEALHQELVRQADT
jgi:hypothetical protein